ncbi:unnamed protein product [Linum trigynum]|uniref:Uncharacterized protein n=1 Tax=Linum trigynum TaxID=586398 RepID=A0AAV2FD23_9ROSI
MQNQGDGKRWPNLDSTKVRAPDGEGDLAGDNEHLSSRVNRDDGRSSEATEIYVSSRKAKVRDVGQRLLILPELEVLVYVEVRVLSARAGRKKNNFGKERDGSQRDFGLGQGMGKWKPNF